MALSTPLAFAQGLIQGDSFDPNNSFSDTQEKVIVQLNGLDAFTEKVLPVITEDNGLEEIEEEIDLPDFELGALGETCYDLNLSLRLNIELPVDRNSVSAEFAEGQKLQSTWDLEDAQVQVYLNTELVDRSDSLKCIGWDIVNLTFGEEHTGSARGLSGGLNVSLQASEDSHVEVKSTDTFTLAFEDVSITDSEVVNWLLDLGTSVSEIFNSGCSTTESCVNNIIQDALETGATKSLITASLNDALDTSLAVSGGVSEDGLEVNYAVGLADFTTSDENTLVTSWSVAVSTSAAVDPCAEELLPTFYQMSDITTLGSDIDVALPFSKIMNTAYAAGQRGVYCLSFAGHLGSASSDGTVSVLGQEYKFSSASVLPNQPLGELVTRYAGEIVPSGAMEIGFDEEASSANNNAILLAVPFRGVLTATTSLDLDENEVTSRLPNSITQREWETDGDFTGTMVIRTHLNLDCREGLYLQIDALELEDVEGEIKVGPVSLSIAELTDDLQDKMEEKIKEQLPYLSLLPQVTNFDGTGSLGIAIEEVAASGNALQVGLEILSRTTNYECLGEAEESDVGSRFSPPKPASLWQQPPEDFEPEELDTGIHDRI